MGVIKGHRGLYDLSKTTCSARDNLGHRPHFLTLSGPSSRGKSNLPFISSITEGTKSYGHMIDCKWTLYTIDISYVEMTLS